MASTGDGTLPPASDPGAVVFQVPAMDDTLGALLVGGLLATALWGVTCVQAASFFLSNSADRKWHKALVGFLWVLDTFDTVLDGHMLYHYLITNFFVPQAILFPVWSVISHVVVTAFSNFVVRGIFARRVYRLSKGNIWGTALIVALSTVDLACGLVISVKAFRIATFPELSSISTLFYVNFASGTAADIAVALALCYMLYTSRTGFERTDSLIRVLMTYTINTGLLVALDAAAGMLTYAFMPDNFWFLGCYLLLGKLYLNSYLAILNARKILRGDGMTSINLSQLSGVRWRTGGPGSGHGHGAEHVFEEEESRTQQGTGLGSQPLAISKMVDVQREEYADDDRQSRPEASRRLSDVEKEAWNPDEKPFR